MTIALLLAGALGGVVGTAGGIASLACYPVLLAVGVHPLAAGLVNNVAFVTCWPASALASRPELRGRARWLAPWTALAAVCSGGGALILLSTPPGVFSRVVPVLVICGVVALALGPRLAARRARAVTARPPGAPRDLALPAGMVPVAVYNGYFGAGSGIMFLALPRAPPPRATAALRDRGARRGACSPALVRAGALRHATGDRRPPRADLDAEAVRRRSAGHPAAGRPTDDAPAGWRESGTAEGLRPCADGVTPGGPWRP